MDNNTLKSADLKQTKKRVLILSVLETASTALTAEEIAELTSKDMKMSISTIYRALNALSDKNVIIKTLHQDGKTYYEINNHTHKHSLLCTLCNERIPINVLSIIWPLKPVMLLPDIIWSFSGYVRIAPRKKPGQNKKEANN